MGHVDRRYAPLRVITMRKVDHDVLTCGHIIRFPTDRKEWDMKRYMECTRRRCIKCVMGCKPEYVV